jgi:hypothetical protein
VTEQTIAVLRDQIAGLLSQIDHGAKPHPTMVMRAGALNPGAAWCPVKNWTVRAFDGDLTSPRSVFVTTPEHVRFDAGRDFDAVTTDDARRLAMALLAAADWADGLAAGVTPLDGRRDDNPTKESS